MHGYTIELQPWSVAAKKDMLDFPKEELLFMEAVNRVTFDVRNIPVIFNIALFFLALLEQPEDPLRDEFTFQGR